jgi:hypothetical protein
VDVAREGLLAADSELITGPVLAELLKGTPRRTAMICGLLVVTPLAGARP